MKYILLFIDVILCSDVTLLCDGGQAHPHANTQKLCALQLYLLPRSGKKVNFYNHFLLSPLRYGSVGNEWPEAADQLAAVIFLAVERLDHFLSNNNFINTQANGSNCQSDLLYHLRGFNAVVSNQHCNTH